MFGDIKSEQVDKFIVKGFINNPNEENILRILETYSTKKGKELVKHFGTMKDIIREEQKVDIKYINLINENEKLIFEKILPRFVSMVEKKDVTYENRVNSSSFNLWDGPGPKGRYWRDIASNPVNLEFIAKKLECPKELDAFLESTTHYYSSANAIANNKNISKETLLKLVVLSVTEDCFRHWSALNAIFNNPNLPEDIGNKLAVIIREFFKALNGKFTISKMDNKYLKHRDSLELNPFRMVKN